MGKKDDNSGAAFIAGAVLGAIGGIIADEKLSVENRIKAAAQRGYEIGKQEKEKELRPRIDTLERQNIDLRNTLTRKEQELRDRDQTVKAKDQEIARLKTELEKTRTKP